MFVSTAQSIVTHALKYDYTIKICSSMKCGSGCFLLWNNDRLTDTNIKPYKSFTTMQ